jgi:hypothetical protein
MLLVGSERRETYHAELQQPLDADPFVGARAPPSRVAPHARTLPRLAAGVPGNRLGESSLRPVDGTAT